MRGSKEHNDTCIQIASRLKEMGYYCSLEKKIKFQKNRHISVDILARKEKEVLIIEVGDCDWRSRFKILKQKYPQARMLSFPYMWELRPPYVWKGKCHCEIIGVKDFEEITKPLDEMGKSLIKKQTNINT